MAEIKLMWDLAQRFCGFVCFFFVFFYFIFFIRYNFTSRNCIKLPKVWPVASIIFIQTQWAYFIFTAMPILFQDLHSYLFFLSVFFFFFCQQDFFLTLLQPILYLRGCWKRVLFFLHGHHWWDLLHNLPDLKYRRFEKWLHIFENIASRRHVC